MHIEGGVTNALPKLPGFNFKDLSEPVNYNKSQLFGWDKGVRVIKEVLPNSGVPVGNMLSLHTSLLPAERFLGIPRETILKKNPQWKTLQDKALRFFGYFTERIDESMIEKICTRKVCITYHLYDATISVVETPAVGNSGFRHGTLMGRHYVPEINLTNLRVGNSILLRSRIIQIVDCDAFTTQFYATMGDSQSDSFDYPTDRFEEISLAPKSIRDSNHTEMKTTNERISAAIMGKVATLMTPEERIKAKNFLEYDRSVLVFFAVWDARKFRVNYYLADGTIAVSNFHAINCGRDLNAAFIKRGYVPMGPNVHNSLETNSASPTKNYTDQDLETGMVMNVFGRDFFLFSCDPFTKQYYETKYGKIMKEYEKPLTEGEKSDVTFPQIAKEKIKKKDYEKYIRHANDVLRFGAQLANPYPEDENRQFIICYYIADETVSVFEFTVHNSGHPGGKIFTRAEVPGIRADSLCVGQIIKVGGFEYYLKEMDDRTKHFLDTGAHMNPREESAKSLIIKVRHAITQKFSRVAEAYRHFNISKKGIGLEELSKMFTKCEVPVRDNDTLMTIMDLVDTDRDGVISLQEFVENVLDQVVVHSKLADPTDGHQIRSYDELKTQQDQKEEGERVLKHFISKLNARRAFIVDTFRIVSDRAPDGMIGVEAFKEAVQGRLAMDLNSSELNSLVYRFFYVPGLKDYTARRLNLREFRRIVEA